MSYTLKIDLPNLPADGTLVIDGLGEFTNQTDNTISDEQAAAYQAQQAYIESDFDDKGFLHNKLMPGRTLVEAFANHAFITVTVDPVVPVKAVTPVVPAAPVVTPPVTSVDATTPAASTN